MIATSFGENCPLQNDPQVNEFIEFNKKRFETLVKILAFSALFPNSFSWLQRKINDIIGYSYYSHGLNKMINTWSQQCDPQSKYNKKLYYNI